MKQDDARARRARTEDGWRWTLGALALALGAVAAGCASSQHSVTGPQRAAHTVRLSYNNVHALVTENGTVLIDAGLEADVDRLVERLASLGVSLSSVEAIVLTHGHADHAGGALALKARTGASIIGGAGDRPLFAGGRNDELCPTSESARDDLEEHQHATYRGFEPDLPVSAPLALKPTIGVDAAVIPVPGHTPGSLMIVAGRWAFVGDLFRGAIVGSTAETHFYMCDLAGNLADIERLLHAYPDVETFFTGHFGPVDRASVEAMVERRRTRG